MLSFAWSPSWREGGEIQRLLSVGDSVVGIRMYLDDKAIGTCRECRAAHRRDQVAPTGRMRGIGDDRQMAQLPGQRHPGQVERVAQFGVVGTDSTFA